MGGIVISIYKYKLRKAYWGISKRGAITSLGMLLYVIFDLKHLSCGI